MTTLYARSKGLRIGAIGSQCGRLARWRLLHLLSTSHLLICRPSVWSNALSGIREGCCSTITSYLLSWCSVSEPPTVGRMFETTFSYASATPIPPSLPIASAIPLLHDFETVIKLSPDCRGCQRIPAPKNSSVNGKGPEVQYWEVEDDLPFIPKRLWSGGVKYTADFVPLDEGCDITIHAPGGFTSVNHWRILRETAPLNEESAFEHHEAPTPTTKSGRPTINRQPTIEKLERSVSKLNMDGSRLERTGTKDHLHAESEGVGAYVQIVSDARCPRTFAGFVKGFLKNTHVTLQRGFIEKLQETPAERRQRRPTLGRRRSSVL